MDQKLSTLRQRIDKVDDQILALLNERAQLAQKVGHLKQQGQQTFYVPSRERAICERLQGANNGPFPDEAIAGVYREIISACLSLEAPLHIAFLGPVATFTHAAAMQQFGQSARFLDCKSIPAVFAEVARERADYGVVPVENSTEGVVTHTLDMFLSSDLTICGEILLPVSHDLLSRSGRLEDVRQVVSHPQALAQCRSWLEEHLPDCPQMDVASTARAAQLATEDSAYAAIAASMAAQLYDLRVVQRHIADQVHNSTRFLVIGRQPQAPTGNDKTSIIFCVKDTPGILCRMLEPFGRQQINLSKIESRPQKDKVWEYFFFLDLDGHRQDPHVQTALTELEEMCRWLKVLGSYPKAVLATEEDACPS